ncbi:MAG: phytoene/squalene synthase family protein [Acidimicrobiales bacterium]
MTPEQAYTACEQITSSQARNFSYGIRLLQPSKRAALSSVYAMARRVDDIGDGPGSVPAKLARLDGVRRDLAGLPGRGDDPVLVALHDAANRFPLPMGAFQELVEGCEMDVRGQAYGTFDELVGYCTHVAGSIGRLSLGVFGASRPSEATARADSLGVALQLTNVLRDIVEDRDRMGRVYLPKQDLERFGLGTDLGGPPEALGALVLLVARRARGYYDEGLGLLPLLDGRSRACTAAMAGIYRRLLARIERCPASVLAGRVSLPPWEKAWVAARSLAGMAP